jgi:hypothetical protein
MTLAAIGFRAKTGRAIAVAICGNDRPSFILREEISLVDPRMPATAQPYHVVMDSPWSEGVLAARKFEKAIEGVAFAELDRLLRTLAAKGYDVKHIGVVGSKDRDLAKLGNPHIRAHAAEGILFRRVLEIAGKEHKKQVQTFSEADVKVSKNVTALGDVAGPPWRADEKVAAMAAWLTLK